MRVTDSRTWKVRWCGETCVEEQMNEVLRFC